MADLTVQTRYGALKGTAQNSVHTWKGVPFAQPPTGEFRFKEPQAPKPWSGVRNAAEFGPVCPQPSDLLSMSFAGAEMPVQSEDCLYLNVYAPDTPEKDLPVMVWIHGGAFYLGAGSEPLYDGSALAAAGDVIVVTLNYRLGPFGFLHLSSIDNSYTNNLGLLDQIAALQWVKDNISAFGGNPENVTIFGESAGGMSIAALLTMPKAKGLFQKAIMESGASQTMPSEKAADIAAAFLETLDIEPDQSELLHSKTSEDILNAADKIRNTNNENIFSLLFQPTADPDTLPVEPEKAIAQGAAEGIPLLIGTNKDEGYLFFTPDSEVMSQAEINQALEQFGGQEFARRAAGLYPPSLESQIHMMTDLLFWRPSITYASAQSNIAPVWMYRFDWHLGRPPLDKAIHALEIPFVFGNFESLEAALQTKISEDTKQLSTHIQTAWITFARTGDPNHSTVEWPNYNEETRKTLIFNSSISIEQDPDADKRKQLERKKI
ncbi:carboxylesterase/lipase family protein [Bacillus atrophaeus]|uniref:carboxylesterase/lipase family protein n=1 Tax=Bacillus atrophaeus TaxID=1452 RepID=UPI002E1FFDB2|nr:carboxylesterase/lipase family protein [Bacillus atrophaeus]